MLATGGMEAFLARHAVHIVLAVAWAVGTAVAWAAGTSARRAPSGESHEGGDAALRRQLAGHELVALLSARVTQADDASAARAAPRQWTAPLLALTSLGAASKLNRSPLKVTLRSIAETSVPMALPCDTRTLTMRPPTFASISFLVSVARSTPRSFASRLISSLPMISSRIRWCALLPSSTYGNRTAICGHGFSPSCTICT